MEKINDILCSCGSGKKLKDCCIFLNEPKQTDCAEAPAPDFTGVTAYHGFTKKYAHLSPFEINYDEMCCLVIQANEYLANSHNEMIGFPLVSPGQWFVMATVGDENKFSFGHRTAEDAMDVAREKHGAVRFLIPPKLI